MLRMTIIQKGEPMDLIDRQAAIDMCRKPRMRNADCSDFEMEIMMLPSAQPERIKGRWERDGHHIKCDQCGEWMCDRDREGWDYPKNFCPNCGAKMEVTT